VIIINYNKMSRDSAATTFTVIDRLTGRVKWFNNKAGYGFITVTDGVRSGSDIFVHHSSINVSSQQYKYLVQGEYVEFDLNHVQGGAHEFQASTVAGIKGGKLMCETRHEFKTVRNAYKTSNGEETFPDTEPVNTPRPKATPRHRPSAEASKENDSKGEWTLIKGTQPAPKARGRPPRKPTV
jgi:CspA family cold shock protein